MREQELFKTYELKGWQLSSRLYQIIGVSVIINLVVFVLMAQANFLTGKTCDSPIASGVCSVLDTLYVGGMIMDTDGTFVSKPYERTEIGDADEITFINVGDYRPLNYPEGYFAQANPEQFTMDPAMTSSEIPGISTPNLMDTPPVLPPNTGSILDGTMPSSPLGNETQPKTRSPKNTSPKTLPKLGDETKAENKNQTSEPVKDGEINRLPFENAADEINAQRANNQIDLTKNFKVVAEGLIKVDGKFDGKRTKFVVSEGDEQMLKAAKAMIVAMGDSGFLKQLRDKGVERINITLEQNDNEIYAILLSDLKTPERAATTSSGLNTLMQSAILLDNNGMKKLDENSKILINNSTISAEGKMFKLNFKLPKQDAQTFIIQALDKRAEKKSNPTPNSEVNNEKTEATAAK